MIIRNINKIVFAEVAKILSLRNSNSKYIWVINNININAAKDLRLTDIKKYWRLTCQIKKEMNELHKNWIQKLTIFIKHLPLIYNNEKITKNIKIK